jgi:hypothetical protein
MRTLLQTLLLALACAGIYSAATVNQTQVDHSFSARAAKTIILADGTEPFPKRILRRPR